MEVTSFSVRLQDLNRLATAPWCIFSDMEALKISPARVLSVVGICLCIDVAAALIFERIEGANGISEWEVCACCGRKSLVYAVVIRLFPAMQGTWKGNQSVNFWHLWNTTTGGGSKLNSMGCINNNMSLVQDALEDALDISFARPGRLVPVTLSLYLFDISFQADASYLGANVDNNAYMGITMSPFTNITGETINNYGHVLSVNITVNTTNGNAMYYTECMFWEVTVDRQKGEVRALVWG